MVSEDASLVPTAVRKRLVAEGTADLSNIVPHDCGPYIISSATFPSYFLKDEETIIESQARLDLTIFTKIAQTLNITARFVGEEPTSLVTGIYNRIMSEELPKANIECRIIPRKALNGAAISASTARDALKRGDLALFRSLVPETTAHWFESEEAKPVLSRIREQQNVKHY